jgi:hypothetical protein
VNGDGKEKADDDGPGRAPRTRRKEPRQNGISGAIV